MRTKALLAAQVLVTVALLWWLIQGLDRDAFRAVVTAIPLWYYAASLGVILAGQLLYAWRWRLLLVAAGLHIPITTILRQYFIGIFVNNFLPGTVGGDAAKVYYLGREHGYRTVTASVVLDRLLGIGILAAAATVALWLIPLGSPRYVAARAAVMTIAMGFAAVIALALSGTGGLAARVARFGTRAEALGARLQRFRLDLAAPVRRPGVLLQAAAVVVGYFLAVTVIYLWFVELNTAARPSFGTMFMVVTTTSVLSNVPISFNGLGVREQLHVWLLAPIGVPPEAALALSLLLFGHMLVGSLCGLVFWLRAPAVSRDDAVRPLGT